MCCVVCGGGGKTGCTYSTQQLLWGCCKARDCFGLLWLGLAGAFGYTPPRDASGDGLWVAEQAEGGAISWPWAVFWGVRWAVAQIQGGAQ